MIEAVFTFACITAIGEMIMMHQLPGLRRFFLKNHQREFVLHTMFAALNLWIHWGTVTGTMTGVTAFVVSVLVARVCKLAYGRA